MTDDTSQEPSAQPDVTTEAPAVEAPYYWQEGMAGEGEKPEWLKSDKYKSVADQAKAYTDLEKKFGSFQGAPEKYEVSEDYDPEDTFVKMLSDIGTKSNMNQSAFDEMLNLGNELLSANSSVNEEQEMKALGPNAQERLDNIDGYLKNNLGDRYEEMKDAVSSAKTVELVEALIKSSVPSSPAMGESIDPGTLSQGDIEKMMTEKDDNGKVIYHMSKSRQKDVREAFAKLKGM